MRNHSHSFALSKAVPSNPIAFFIYNFQKSLSKINQWSVHNGAYRKQKDARLLQTLGINRLETVAGNKRIWRDF